MASQDFTWRCIVAALGVPIWFAGCRPVADTEPLPPIIAPQNRERGPDVIVAELAREDRLTLANPSSPLSRFSFVVEGQTGDPLRKVFEVETAASHPHAAVVVRAVNGMPYAYMTAGFCVAVNTDRQGGLLAVQAGTPDVQLHARDGSLAWHVRHTANEGSPVVAADVRSVLKAMLPYDTLRMEGQRLSLVKGGSELLLELQANDAPAYPLRAWSIGNGAGMGLKMRSIRTGADAEALKTTAIHDGRVGTQGAY